MKKQMGSVCVKNAKYFAKSYRAVPISREWSVSWDGHPSDVLSEWWWRVGGEGGVKRTTGVRVRTGGGGRQVSGGRPRLMSGRRATGGAGTWRGRKISAVGRRPHGCENGVVREEQEDEEQPRSLGFPGLGVEIGRANV